MKLHWPWRRHEPDGNGHAAEAAKAAAEAKLRAQQQRWPEVLRARDELARLAERAMRGTR
jgi:hypothetical protein